MKTASGTALRLLMALVGIPACAGLGWYIYQESLHRSQSPPRKTSEENQAVQTVTVTRRTMEETVNLVGGLEPSAKVLLRARAAGYITGLKKDVGDEVQETKTVIELDESSHQQAVAEAKAALEVAKAQRDVARKRQEPARLLVQQYQRLKEKDNATQQDVDNAQAQLDVLTEQLKLEEKNVAKAETDFANRKLALKETKIASTITGFVAERHVEVGDLANPNDPLMLVVDLRNVRLHVAVIEEDYGKIQVGQSARIHVDAFRGETFTGRIVRKAPAIDPDTKTGLVQVEIGNADYRLKPGMTARASIVVNRRENVPVVPIAAVMKRGAKQLIYTVVGKPPKIVSKAVTVGLNDGEFIEILTGVQETDRVVTLGNRLVDVGQVVIPVKVKTPTETVESKSTVQESGGG